jgi:uncharacterized protein YuzE
MRILGSIAPNLVIEVEAALTAEGRAALVPQVASAKVDRCAYDQAADAGYIYFVRPFPSPHFAKLATPVAETIAFLEKGFNVDVDHDGNLFGIELLSRPDVIDNLREANAL